MSATEPTPEEAVRTYLLYVQDPTQLRNDKLIASQIAVVRKATDPIEKLVAIADLERLTDVDEKPLREAFVAQALAWAETNHIPASAFTELGVAPDVLRSAGFKVPQGAQRGKARAKRRRGPSREKVRAAILRWPGDTFVMTDITSAADVNDSVASRVLQSMVKASEVEYLGRQERPVGWKGPTPKIYRVVAERRIKAA